MADPVVPLTAAAPLTDRSRPRIASVDEPGPALRGAPLPPAEDPDEDVVDGILEEEPAGARSLALEPYVRPDPRPMAEFREDTLTRPVIAAAGLAGRIAVPVLILGMTLAMLVVLAWMVLGVVTA